MRLEVAIIGAPALPVFQPSLSAEAIAEKDNALATSALIGKVTNREENDAANNARKGLREISGLLDRQRKKLTEPFVEAQRLLIRIVEPHIDELKREDGRLELLVKDFALAEQRRIREEQEAQQRELARIEAERQAELRRIQEEQERKEREAREAREAAERAASEARSKKEREAAAKALQEAEAKRKEAEAAAALAAQEAQLVNEQANLSARIESKPVEITRSAGQTTKKVWKITQINDFQLVRARPDLVRKIEWDIVAIKQLLADGVKLPGVTAEEDLSVGVRGRATRTVDV